MATRDGQQDRAGGPLSRRHHELYRRKEYARLRRRCLDRDGWRCQECGRAGRMELHHIVSLQKGGAPLDPANLTTLCRRCHWENHTLPEITGRPTPPPDPERAALRELAGLDP